MSNVFKRFTEVVNKPNRASYDLSFQNNLTMKFGKLYPVFCKEVLPGDSFKIQPTFNFNFMPLVSPIQTRMKATLHFFYVRNRPLWKDFMDWDGMTKEGLTPPYIKLTEQNRDMLNTGEIGDFFGIPSQIYGYTAVGSVFGTPSMMYPNFSSLTFTDNWANVYVGDVNDLVVGCKYTDVVTSRPPIGSGQQYPGPYGHLLYQNFVTGAQLLRNFAGTPAVQLRYENDFAENTSSSVGNTYLVALFDMDGTCIRSTGKLTFDGSDDIRVTMLLNSSSPDLQPKISLDANYLLVMMSPINWVNNSSAPTFAVRAQTVVADADGTSVSEIGLASLPWASTENPDGLRLNAFPFRAYEAIYNSFYRDERNNPRIVNGQPEYNKYITTDEGGADTTHYKLFQRNWEPDYLTTAVQSPQQGVAPLVGITSVTAAGTIEITDGNGVTYTAQTKLAEDGDTIQGINVLSENSPTAVNRALVDLASTGISISDLRNVNALQRWLEINMRRGLRYRDQVKSHYGVDIEFKELQMPEFIGGVNEDVIVNRISQTVETEENPLGSLAGQAGVLGTSKHKISHYCDEKGFIIGIFSIAPVPNYSQNLPKHMIKTSQLDYFTPEFAHIGMQPIFNSEVTPLQANLEGKLNDVFGYQRPWYDYLASTDEVHGQFRDTMRRYLINRVYDGTPELGSEFLTIDSDTINDVFAVTEDTDKIYGQIWFDVTAKRPIASNVTPRIEP